MVSDLSRRAWLTTGGLAAAGLAWHGSGAMRLTGEPDVSLEPPVIRLDANENPWGPSEKAREAFLAAAANLNRYPSYPKDLALALERAIAERDDLTPEHVVLGPGSFSVLCLAGLAYGLADGEIVAADTTFEALMTYASRVGARVARVPLDAALTHDLGALAARVSPATRLVYVCNPNNPTGTIVDGAALRSFCEEVGRKATVLVDEAYREYAASPRFGSMVELVRNGANVIVSHTFSKIHGLAGLRVGYAVARPDIAARLRRLRMGPLGISGPALAAALASLRDTDFVELSRERNAEGRTRATAFLRSHGLEATRSEGSFLFFRPPGDLAAFGDALRRRNVRVGAGCGQRGCRLTIGTPEEMKRFESAFEAALEERS